MCGLLPDECVVLFDGLYEEEKSVFIFALIVFALMVKPSSLYP